MTVQQLAEEIKAVIMGDKQVPPFLKTRLCNRINVLAEEPVPVSAIKEDVDDE